MDQTTSRRRPATVPGEVQRIGAVWSGQPYPRGATWDGEGVNFSIFSANAEKVELCLFDPGGRHETQRITLRERTDEIWHCYLAEARPGLLYGYRVHGPYRPERGQRFNPNKLLIEPCAKRLEGTLLWSDAHFGYRVGNSKADLSFDKRDSASGTPKSRVTDSAFTWSDDRPPRVPWHDTVDWELDADRQAFLEFTCQMIATNFLLLCNAHHEAIPFQLSEPLTEKTWWTVLDTAAAHPFAQQRLEAGTRYPLQGRSLALLRETAYR